MQVIVCIRHDQHAVELASFCALHRPRALQEVDRVARICETERQNDNSRDNARRDDLRTSAIRFAAPDPHGCHETG